MGLLFIFFVIFIIHITVNTNDVLCYKFIGNDKDVINHKNIKLLPDIKTCGKEKTSGKIMGGVDARLGQFPWLVVFVNKSLENPGPGSAYCGGSIINSRYVLTAAHCIDPKVVQEVPGKIALEVRIGEYDLNSEIDCDVDHKCLPPAKTYAVEEVIPHEGYEAPQHHLSKNDIGLLRLAEEIPFNDNIYPICLPVTSDMLIKDNSHYVKATAAGWGFLKTEPDTVATSKLQTAQLVVVPEEECAKVRKVQEFASPHLICAGLATPITCEGDSGTPLMWKKGATFFEVGLLSLGTQCNPRSSNGGPNMFTRVDAYMLWILDQIRE